MTRASVGVAAVLLAGCAALPATDDVAELGKSIAATGSVFRGAISANRTIAFRIGDEVAASKLIQRRAFSLADRPAAMRALTAELTRIIDGHLQNSAGRYKPLTEAITAASGTLKAAKKRADRLAQALNLGGDLLASFGKLAGALA